MNNLSLRGAALGGLALQLTLLAMPTACAPAAPDPTVDEPFEPLARIDAAYPSPSTDAASPTAPPPDGSAPDPRQDAGVDSSTGGGDAGLDGALDASPDAWADAGTIIAMGELPVPIAFRRFAYVGQASPPNSPAKTCPAGSSTSTPLGFNAGGSCCFAETAASASAPVTVTLATAAGSERVCLVGASTSACALVAPSGLATFAESRELEALYNRWGLNYRVDFSSTSLTFQLAPSRDRATVTLQVSARIFGSGCGAGQGSYLPQTTLDVPLR
ncbi:MAG: hypothetical protein IPK71_12645 [Myxococcales bacterium]|nr:hypothetical protein [Myxococcales bacterium]